MQLDAVIKEIKRRRDAHHDVTFAAGPGTTDPGIIEGAQRAAEYVTEYDDLLAAITSQSASEPTYDISRGSDSYFHIVCQKCGNPCKLSLPPTRQTRSTSGYSENIIDIECPTCGIQAKLAA